MKEKKKAKFAKELEAEAEAELCIQRKHLLGLFFPQQLAAKRNLQTPSAIFGAVALGLVFTAHRPHHPAGVAI